MTVSVDEAMGFKNIFTRYTPAFVFLLVFLLYAFSLTPTIDFADSGDFATAAYVWGIAHPPGFPLLTILGKLAMTIIPFGSFAWRMGLVSAGAGALACAVIYLLVYLLANKRSTAIIAALAFGVSTWNWSQSAIIEAYSLNVLFFLAIQYFFIKWRTQKLPKYLYAMAAITGLSLTNHLSIVFYCLPPLFILTVYDLRKKWPGTTKFLIAAACFVIPLGLYAYLPIAASFDPIKNVGNPVTFQNFIDHVSMKQYAGFVSFLPLRLYPHILRDALFTFIQQYWILLPIGLYGLFKIPPISRAILFSMFIFSMFFGITAARLVPEHHQYLIPAIADFAVFIGFGIAALQEKIRKETFANIFLAILVIAVTLNAVLAYKPILSKKNFEAMNFAKTTLENMPKNSVLFSTDDFLMIPLQYAQYVEGIRPDITIVSYYLLKVEWVQHFLQRNGLRTTATSRITTMSAGDIIKELVTNNPDRIFYTSYGTEGMPSGMTAEYDEPLLRIVKSKDAARNTPSLRNWPNRSYLDYREYRKSQNLGVMNIVNVLMNQSDFSRARQYVEKGIGIDPFDPVLWKMKSQIAFMQGQHNESVQAALKVVAVDPTFYGNYHFAGSVLDKEGDPAKAAEYFELGLDYALPPRINFVISSHFALVDIYRRLGDIDNMKKHLRALLEFPINPSDRAKIEQMLSQIN